MTRPLLIAAILASVAGTARADAASDCQPPSGENPHADPSLKSPAEPAEAVDHLTRGKAAHRVQDYDEAISEFKAGAKLSPAPVFLYALGQSFRLAGRYQEAIRSYELFLDRAQPGEVLRAVVECHIGKMRAELDRAAMTTPPTDQPSDTDSGDQTPTQVDATPWYRDPVGWSLVGGGVLAGAVGGALLLDAADLEDQAKREDRESARDALRSQAATRGLWGGVATGVGVVALTAGVVKLVLTPHHSRRERVTFVPGPSVVGLGLVARF